MKATKVFLRQRKLNSGKITLYLDYYPPLRDPVTQDRVFRDYLGIYLVDNPKFAMRTWLIRLGFVGEEFETAREILTRNLPGDAAFRNGRTA